MSDLLKQMKEQYQILIKEGTDKLSAAEKLLEAMDLLQGSFKPLQTTNAKNKNRQACKRGGKGSKRDSRSPLNGAFGTRAGTLNKRLYAHIKGIGHDLTNPEICDFLCREGILKYGRKINIANYIDKKLFKRMPGHKWYIKA